MENFQSRDRARQFHANYHSGPKQRSIETHGQTLNDLNSFQTPNAVSAREEQGGTTNTASPLINGKKPPKKRKSLKEWLRTRTPKQWVIIGIVAFVILAGLGIGAWAIWGRNDKTQPPAVTVQEPEPQPTTVASNLTGVQVDPSVNQRPVTAVMIENSPVSRPQSGLHEAGIVHEAIAEGGITRFMALYQDHETDYIGPVRSIRKPWLHWLLGYDGALAHVGGSAEALQLIRDWNVKDLDQFASPGAYWRIGERTAPHNVYTSIQRLRDVENQKGYGAAKFTSLQRKSENPAKPPKTSTINIDPSSANYAVRYQYDPGTNSYKRFLGGEPHVDERSGIHLSPKVVIAPVMSQGHNGIYTTYETLGSGKVFIFQDGLAYEGTWHKSANDAPFTFTDANNNPLRLNPGQTWFTVVGTSDRVTHAP